MATGWDKVSKGLVGYYSDGGSYYYYSIGDSEMIPFDRIVEGLMASGQSKEMAQKKAALSLVPEQVQKENRGKETKEEKDKVQYSTTKDTRRTLPPVPHISDRKIPCRDDLEAFENRPYRCYKTCKAFQE